jgi:peroxiredoxin
MLYARLLMLTVALLTSHALAQRAPDFDVKDMAGNRYTLAGLSGKLVVLNFWFKDCPVCRSERGELNRVVARYPGSEDVVFLAPALDKAPALKSFLRRNPFRYAVVPDSEGLAEAYGVSEFPTHVIIGRDGKILRRWIGAVDTFYRLTDTIDAETEPPTPSEPSQLVSALPIGSSPLWEPTLLVRPERPTRGATVKLFYAPQSLQHPPEAQVSWDIHGDTSFTQGVAPMRTQGVLLAYELKLPEDATLVHLRILSRQDRRIVEHTLPVSGADGQPVRNAFVHVGACDTPLPLEQELERYPGSPFALLERLEERMSRPGTPPEAARAELLGLLKTADGKGLELLAVTADALLLAGELKAVNQVLDTMVALDRDAFLTRRTLSRLVTQPYGDLSRQWPAGLLPWAWKVLAERDDVWSRRAASQSTARLMDTASAEKICATWRTTEPDNAFAHDCLARVLERQGRLQEALGARRTAIEAVSTGTLPLYYRGSWSRMAREEEELWARHAELSLVARSQPEFAGPLEP